MKKIFTKNPLPGSLLALLLLITAIACKKDKTDLSGTFQLEQKSAYEFKQGDKVIATAALTEIKDSRCPISANCIDAGYGMVSLKIKDLGIGGEKNITLYLEAGVPKGKNVAEISLNGTSYLLLLKEINPYPQVYVANPAPLSASLSLTKL